jgi:receptor protein-tyrosine kinase
MTAESRDIIAHRHGSAILKRNAQNARRYAQSEDEQPTNLVALRRNVMEADPMGLVSERDFRHIVTTRFEYPPVRRNPPELSESLVAAFTPFSAKGRAIRYLAARILFETGSEPSLCFSVCGPERKSGATFIAANLAVAFSEFGLRTLLVDANQARPDLHRLFACDPSAGLSTLTRLNDAPGCSVVPLPSFRGLSLLPAGKIQKRRDRRSIDDLLSRRLKLERPGYDVVICDAPAYTSRTDDCEVVAGICGSALSVFRRNHTRVSTGRAMLSQLDAVGARPIGSVLCEF